MGADFNDFNDHYQKVKDKIQRSQARVVVILEKNPILYLAAFWACVSSDLMTVLGDPYWRELEYRQVFKNLKADLILGDEGAEQFNTFKGNNYDDFINYILIATGGTTGVLKFVMHSIANLKFSAGSMLQFLGLDTINHFSVLPPWHISGLMPFVRSLVSGGKFKYIEPKHIKDLGDVPEKSFLSVVPSVLEKWISEESICSILRKFKGIFVGGASFPENLLVKAIGIGLPVLKTYGLTETASMIALHNPKLKLIQDPYYSGLILPYVKAYVNPVGKNKVLCIESESLAYGYYPSKPKKWTVFKTEDKACIKGNQLYILGRKDKIIITGGKKVDPGQVKNALMQTGWIRECIVFAKPDKIWGQALAVVYTLRQNVTKEELKAKLKVFLAAYKIPKYWYNVQSIPLNSKNKVCLKEFME